MLALVLSVSAFLFGGDLQKPLPQLEITTRSNGLEGSSIPLTVYTGGSTGAVTWSVADITGTAAINGANLDLQQAGTVALKIEIAEDATYAAWHTTKLITINVTDGQDTEMMQIWGITSTGGAGNAGTLFRMNADGTGYTKMSEFSAELQGAVTNYNNPIIASDGNLYGTLANGGKYGSGVIYKYDLTNNTYTVVYNFQDLNGTTPWSELFEHTDGKFYGTTSSGGTYNLGVLFSFDKSSNTYEVLYNFDGENGSTPASPPRAGANGKLYGTTSRGGSSNSINGTFYEYDPATETFTKKFNFDGGAGGSKPFSAPRLASNNKLYFTTKDNALSGAGSIYEYDPAIPSMTLKKDLSPGQIAWCFGGFTPQSSGGKLYTSGNAGGAEAYGSIGEYTPGATDITIKYSFPIALKEYPMMNTTLGSNGKLYGVTGKTSTTSGVAWGAIYQYDPANNNYSRLYELTDGPGSTALVEGAAGIFYGVLGSDGTTSKGKLFRYDVANNQFTILSSFNDVTGPASPKGDLAAIGDKLYMSTGGGLTYQGTMASFDRTTNVLTKIKDYTTSDTQSVGFVSNLNGKLYSVISSGTTGIYSYDPVTGDRTFFNNAVNASGKNQLVAGDDGLMYGIQGDDPGSQAVYVFNPSDPDSKIAHPFGTTAEMGRTHDGLSWGPGGKLYGVALSGGANGQGIIYSFDPSDNSFEDVYDFELPYFSPTGGVTLADNGKFYGIAYTNPYPTRILYEFDPATGDFTPKQTFDTETVGPGPLFKSSTGNLFGYTTPGSEPNSSILYIYDPVNNTVSRDPTVHLGNGVSSWLLLDPVTGDGEEEKDDPTLALEIEDKTFGDDPFTIEASTNSDGEVSYSFESDKITMDGDEVTIVEAGRVSITASVAETETFNTASTEASFCINPAKPIVDTMMLTGGLGGIVELISLVDDGNQWYRDGEALEGATEKTFDDLSDGVYTLTVTVDDCTSEPSLPVVIETSGLEDDLASLVRLYPNPAVTELHVELPGAASSVQVSLADHLGRAIESRNAQGGTTEKFHVGHLPASLYIVRVAHGGKTISKVFVKR